jgi:hypothetical protein
VGIGNSAIIIDAEVKLREPYLATPKPELRIGRKASLNYGEYGGPRREALPVTSDCPFVEPPLDPRSIARKTVKLFL